MQNTFQSSHLISFIPLIILFWNVLRVQSKTCLFSAVSQPFVIRTFVFIVLFCFHSITSVGFIWRGLSPFDKKLTLNYCPLYVAGLVLKRPPAIPNTRRNQFEFNLAFFRASFCCFRVVFTLFDFCNFIHNKLDLGFEKPIGVDRGVWNNILFDKNRFAAG